MNFQRSSFMGSIPPITKNLIIINVLCWLGSLALFNVSHYRVEDLLGLHYFRAEAFNPFQMVSYMFLHSYVRSFGGFDFSHLFFNMFALYMFGRTLEQVWGGKRFLIYYLATGVGAAICQMIVLHFQLTPVVSFINDFMNNPSSESLKVFLEGEGFKGFPGLDYYYQDFIREYNGLLQSNPERALSLAKDFLNKYQVDFLNAHVTIGASGAVFGILLAFGMLFPNSQIMLLFPPIPMKAKFFVILYGAAELVFGVANIQGDNVAHFAHLGGMIFGFFLIKYWNRHTKNFY